jgi:putative copper resistance protein D
MEFLIDRFGYIRARWIPDEEPGEWSGSDLLQQQVAILNAEPRLLPPPDDHVH